MYTGDISTETDFTVRLFADDSVCALEIKDMEVHRNLRRIYVNRNVGKGIGCEFFFLLYAYIT